MFSFCLFSSSAIVSTVSLESNSSKDTEKNFDIAFKDSMPGYPLPDSHFEIAVREKYKLYDNKICTGDEAAECRFCMQKRMESIGYQVAVNRGDFQP